VPPFGRASGSRAGVVNPDNGSPSASSDKAIQTEKQLADLKGEIDAVTAKIDAKEAERKTETNGAEKGVLLKSIEVLNEALKDLRATRAKLIDASIATPVPVPGKSTPLYEFCLVLSTPPSLCAYATNLRSSRLRLLLPPLLPTAPQSPPP